MKDLSQRIDETATKLLEEFKKPSTNKEYCALERENKKLYNKLEQFKEKHKQRLHKKKEIHEQKTQEITKKLEGQIEHLHEHYKKQIKQTTDECNEKIFQNNTSGNIIKIKNEAYQNGQNSLRGEITEYKQRCAELERTLSKYQKEKNAKFWKTTAYILLAAKITATTFFLGYYIAEQHKNGLTYPALGQQR